MKISDIINTYQCLNEDILEESKLSTKFSFGFELEAICDSDITLLQKTNDKSGIGDYHSGSEGDKNSPGNNLYKLLNKRLGFGNGTLNGKDEQKYATITDDKQILWLDKSIDGIWTFDSVGIYKDGKPVGFKNDKYLNFNKDIYKKYKSIPKYLRMNKNSIEGDSSIETTKSNRETAFPFEYKSPIIPVNPSNFERVIRFLITLKDIGVETNDTCGFHTHISYEGITRDDTKWILFCIANDQKLYKLVTQLDSKDAEISFFDYYATTAIFDKLKVRSSIKNYNAYISTSFLAKKTNMRVHPQGTLEWRGPRGFIGKGENPKLIKDFIVQLYKLVIKIGQIVDLKEYNGYSRDVIVPKIILTGEFNSRKDVLDYSSGKNIYRSVIENPNLLITMNPKNVHNLLMYDKHILDTFSIKEISSIWTKIPYGTKKEFLKENPDGIIEFLNSYCDYTQQKIDRIFSMDIYRIYSSINELNKLKYDDFYKCLNLPKELINSIIES